MDGEVPVTNDAMYSACFYVAAVMAQAKDDDAVHFRTYDGAHAYPIRDIHPVWKFRANVLQASGLEGFYVSPSIVGTLDRMCTVDLPNVHGQPVTLMVYEAALASLSCSVCAKKYKSCVNARCCEAFHAANVKAVKGRVKFIAATWNCLSSSERQALIQPGAQKLARELWETKDFPKNVEPLVRAACLHDVTGKDLAQALHVASEQTCVLPGIARARYLDAIFGVADELAILAFSIGTRVMATGLEMELVGTSFKEAYIHKLASDDRAFKSLRFFHGSWADCTE